MFLPFSWSVSAEVWGFLMMRKILHLKSFTYIILCVSGQRLMLRCVGTIFHFAIGSSQTLKYGRSNHILVTNVTSLRG